MPAFDSNFYSKLLFTCPSFGHQLSCSHKPSFSPLLSQGLTHLHRKTDCLCLQVQYLLDWCQKFWSDILMMVPSMVIGPIISIIQALWLPEESESFDACFYDQWKCMFIALVLFECTLLLITSSAVEFSVCIGMWGCQAQLFQNLSHVNYFLHIGIYCC